MKKIGQFIDDAGGWGLTSTGAALLLYLLAIWKHAHDAPLPAFILLVITLPLFWIGAFVAWSRVRKELEL
jgi:hypothetical protein